MRIITIKDGYQPGFLTWNCVLPTMAHKLTCLGLLFSHSSHTTNNRYITYGRHTMKSPIARGLLNPPALLDGCTALCRGGSWAWEAGGGRTSAATKLAILASAPKKLSGVLV